MSRIAKIPVQIVQGVSYTLTADNITVKGPQGEVSMHILPFVTITEEDGALHFKQVEETREANANVGTMRALVADMVKGCSVGFQKKLQLVGVGYRAQAQGDKLNLSLGFSHPVDVPDTEDCTIVWQDPNHFSVTGIDKQKVGQYAAEIRAKKPPEPYKGKGVRYADEVVVIKETKKK